MKRFIALAATVFLLAATPQEALPGLEADGYYIEPGSTATEQVVSAFEHLTFESPSGDVTMSLGKGHQAVQGTTLGVVKNDKGVISYTDLRHFKPEEVTPPEGVKSIDWIKGGLKH